MNGLEKLISVIQETRAYLAREGNDFSWSSWEDQGQALADIDSLITSLENGSVPDMEVLFAPTGPVQEVSLNSGWTEEFLRLAELFGETYAMVKNQS